MKSWIKSLAIGVLCGLAFAGAAMLLAPLVHADEASYVNDLALVDVPVTPVTLPLGHMICAQISAHGYDGVDSAVRNAISSGVPQRQMAAIIVTAVQELCPSNTPALNAWENEN
jgi:hypothetical protein